ncbi:MAG: 30S ribosomal protein S9 [Ignavibacteria bacterium]|nr:30S ribosomal protein S9 [Ignavibacteria bacterium]
MVTSQNNIKLGRRKTAVARVRLINGTGKVVVNRKEAINYFKSEHFTAQIIEPLKLTNTETLYDVYVVVNGGGVKGQIGAIKLGISRALVEINEDFRKILRSKDLLTRDPRMVERKKYGRPKARKRFQFSKR